MDENSTPAIEEVLRKIANYLLFSFCGFGLLWLMARLGGPVPREYYPLIYIGGAIWAAIGMFADPIQAFFRKIKIKNKKR